jgi:hypothetical protein
VGVGVGAGATVEFSKVPVASFPVASTSLETAFRDMAPKTTRTHSTNRALKFPRLLNLAICVSGRHSPEALLVFIAIVATHS